MDQRDSCRGVVFGSWFVMSPLRGHESRGLPYFRFACIILLKISNGLRKSYPPPGCGANGLRVNGGSNYDSLNVAKCLVIQLVTRMNGSTRFLPRCCFGSWFVMSPLRGHESRGLPYFRFACIILLKISNGLRKSYLLRAAVPTGCGSTAGVTMTLLM